MSQRLAAAKVAPAAYQAMRGVQEHVNQNGLDRKLGELVKMRASQINGCAFCLDMHIEEARRIGETQLRIDLLPVWEEAGELYTPSERAALALTEAVTRISEKGVPDAVYAEAAKHFSEKELVELTLAICVINSWNRLSVTFRATPASLTRAKAKAA